MVLCVFRCTSHKCFELFLFLSRGSNFDFQERLTRALDFTKTVAVILFFLFSPPLLN